MGSSFLVVLLSFGEKVLEVSNSCDEINCFLRIDRAQVCNQLIYWVIYTDTSNVLCLLRESPLI